MRPRWGTHEVASPTGIGHDRWVLTGRGQRRSWRWLAGVAAVAVLGTSISVAGTLPSSASHAPAPSWKERPDPGEVPEELPARCKSTYRSAVQWKSDVSRVDRDRVVVFDGQQVRVKDAGWRVDDRKHGAWSLWFHSLVWLVLVAMEDPDLAVEVFMERDRALPDPGASASKWEKRETGWTQGQFRNRLETVTCLYELTGDKRLRPIAHRLAKANMDPYRYPGLPYKKVHNHGAMSNIALIQAGTIFGVQEWIDVALKRLEADLREVFEPCGMMYEQASVYQLHNIKLWEKAASMIGEKLEAPRQALGALVRPDGVLEAIGDGNPLAGLEPSGASLWCEETGWGAVTRNGHHLTVRFGPREVGHGHLDHGGVTWFAAGVPVLSDRGLFDKRRDDRYEYAHGMSAHSVFEPVGHPDYDPETSGVNRSDRLFKFSDERDGITRSRTIEFDGSTLRVMDTGSGAESWIQHWQLAPGWTPTATGAVHSSGATLTLRCDRMKAVRVEHYSDWRVADQAWDLQCRAKPEAGEARLVTTLVVTPAPEA